MAMNLKTQERIETLFSVCSDSIGIGTVDLKSIIKLFWPFLDNEFTLVDLAGVYTVSTNSYEFLNIESFTDFFKALAKVKYPDEINYCEKLLEVIQEVKAQGIVTGVGTGADSTSTSNSFSEMMEKDVIRVLLIHDLAIKKAYSNFCGQSVRVGGKLTWEEVKSMSVGMEIDGFIAFAGVYSLIPNHLETKTMEEMFREILNRYPLIENRKCLGTTIMFPQFQIALALCAMEIYMENDEDEGMCQYATKNKYITVTRLTIYLRLMYYRNYK